MTKQPVKGKLVRHDNMAGSVVSWVFTFEEPIHVEDGDSLVLESYYGFGNVFHMFIEKGETKDETSS